MTYTDREEEQQLCPRTGLYDSSYGEGWTRRGLARGRAPAANMKFKSPTRTSYPGGRLHIREESAAHPILGYSHFFSPWLKNPGARPRQLATPPRTTVPSKCMIVVLTRECRSRDRGGKGT